MKPFKILSIVGIIIIWFSFNHKQQLKYQDGDIIFQTTGGEIGKGIQMATHSKYNHCGILFYENNKWMVYEAIQPVCKTSLVEFNKRGVGTVKRLNAANFTNDQIQKLKMAFLKFNNKNYDELYGWSDEKIYCSELVYKMYKNALNIELCMVKTFKDYDLSNPLVKEKLKDKFGKEIPMDEKIVSPGDLFDSEKLVLIK